MKHKNILALFVLLFTLFSLAAVPSPVHAQDSTPVPLTVFTSFPSRIVGIGESDRTRKGCLNLCLPPEGGQRRGRIPVVLVDRFIDKTFDQALVSLRQRLEFTEAITEVSRTVCGPERRSVYKL